MGTLIQELLLSHLLFQRTLVLKQLLVHYVLVLDGPQLVLQGLLH